MAQAEEGACSPGSIGGAARIAPAAPDPASPSFGVHIWPGGLLHSPPAVDRLAALHPAHLRFSLGPSWRQQPPLDPGMDDAALDRYVAAGYAGSPGLAETIAFLRDLHARTGAGFDLIVWEPPRIGEPADIRWRTLQPQAVSIVARFHVANLRFLDRLALPIEAVELSNEPDGTWAIGITPAEYVDMVAAIRHEAARRKVALPAILGPGVSTATASRDYFADPAIAARMAAEVNILSLHTWDDKLRRDHAAAVDDFLHALPALRHWPQVWVTEFGMAQPFPDAADPRLDPEKRVADSIALTETYAVIVARDLLRLYGEGIGAVIYWEFQDQSWGDGLLGLLDVGGTPKPVYDALRRVAEQIALRKPRAVALSADGRSAVLVGGAGRYLFIWNTDAQAFDYALPQDAHLSLQSGEAADLCREPDGQAGVRVPPFSLVGLALDGDGAAPGTAGQAP